MEKFLFKLGFVKKRQSGSHALYKHTDGRYTTIAHHCKDLPRCTIRDILSEINVETEFYNNNI